MLGLIIAFLLGLIFGGFSIGVLLHKKSSGKLLVDQSDPEENPYLFLELTSSPYEIMKNKYVTLEVKKHNFISQK